MFAEPKRHFKDRKHCLEALVGQGGTSIMAENDPRGAFSLLAPILDPIDTTITPEQVASGDYQIPEIFNREEMMKLPPG